MIADEVIDLAYRSVLGRDPDPTGRDTWRKRLETVPPERIFLSLLTSPEFRRRYIREELKRDGRRAASEIAGLLVHFQTGEKLHPLRLKLVQEIVPAGAVVLDLGGASGTPQGALLEMGYPHAKDLTIVDLPMDVRMKPGPDTAGERTFGQTLVRFSYHSMADLHHYPDDHFDLVWSGQTFEHITEQEGAALFPQVARVLKPGGVFALDTPNRAITRLTIGDEIYIHAEHKIEYYFDDFTERFDAMGLQRRKSLGLMNMPRSLRLGHAALEELASPDINDQPASSYCFYVEYQKPARS